MNALTTAGRILAQLRHDPRTLAMIMVVPVVFMGLLAWVFQDQDRVFDSLAPKLLAVFPLILMFLVTSIATLRERRSGTLERLLTMPLSKAGFMGGYALAFGLLAAVQAVVATMASVWWLGMQVDGPMGLLLLVAVLNGLVGTSLGLLCSGFAQSEFQAVQFLPALVLPQALLCGLLVPTDRMPDALEAASKVLPLTYAVDAMNEITASSSPDLGNDLWVLVGFVLVFLVGAALTLRRRTD